MKNTFVTLVIFFTLFGMAKAATEYFNGNPWSGQWIDTTSYGYGIGSSTPWARVSLHANAVDAYTTLFAIGSSTPTATTTLFSISNTGTVNLFKGTTLAAPLRLSEGATTTTAVDGEIEMDSNTFYGTTDGGNRGYIPVRHFIRADATRTFTSNTSEQAIFTSPANGRITLETGLYKFEGLIQVASMSATSGNGAVDILGAGTAVVGAWSWAAVGNDAAAGAAGAAAGGSWMQAQQSAASIVTAGTGTGLSVRVRGTFEVTTAGTMIPSFTMVTAAASVLQIGSYMMFERIGGTTYTTVGQFN